MRCYGGCWQRGRAAWQDQDQSPQGHAVGADRPGEFAARYPRADSTTGFAKLKPRSTSSSTWPGKLMRLSQKSPRTRPAGAGYADPNTSCRSNGSRAARRIKADGENGRRTRNRHRHLDYQRLGAQRSILPGEMSKTFRLASMARELIQQDRGFEVDFLDLSRLTSERGRVIYPCKSRVSTRPCASVIGRAPAIPPCHRQVNDWMADIYPNGRRRRGVMIVTPVTGTRRRASLKLIDRPAGLRRWRQSDPSSTHGKIATEAKQLELAGWPYPRHLAGRVFSLVVHGERRGSRLCGASCRIGCRYRPDPGRAHGGGGGLSRLSAALCHSP